MSRFKVDFNVELSIFINENNTLRNGNHDSLVSSLVNWMFLSRFDLQGFDFNPGIIYMPKTVSQCNSSERGQGLAFHLLQVEIDNDW